MGCPINPTEMFPTAYYSERLTEDEKLRLETIRKINTDAFVEEYCKAHNLEHLLRKDVPVVNVDKGVNWAQVENEHIEAQEQAIQSAQKCGPKGAVHDYVQVPGDKCNCYESQWAPNIGCGLLDDVMYPEPEDEYNRYFRPTRFLRWLSIKLFFADLLDFFPRCLEAIWR